MNILVFDIETIPDIDAGRQLYELSNLSDADTVKALYALRHNKNSNFLPHYLQKIIVISLVLQQESNLKVWSLGDVQSSEKDLIQRFFSGLEKYKPTLVSWNGCGFDLPVLHYRSLLYGISAPIYWEHGQLDSHFRWNNYLNRFHYRHLDLMDILAAYQNKAFAPLDDIASMLGFPGKMGMSGDKVWEQYLNGNLKSIRDYCETDVLNTYCVYLRFELIRGNLQRTEYEKSIQNLRFYLTKKVDQKHLSTFLKNMNVGESANLE